MKNTVLLLIVLFLSSSALAQSNPTKTRDCFRGHFSTHETWLNFLASKKKNFNQQAFLKRYPKENFDKVTSAVNCTDFLYQVDGHTIDGFYLAPKTQADKPLPVIIFNRGGNGAFGRLKFAHRIGLIAKLAMRGYVVIASQYRGSNKRINSNGMDEFGGRDVNDVLALLPMLKKIPQADSENIAMMGWSRGSMQSYLAAQHIPELKALIAVAGVSDLHARLKYRPKMERVYKARIPGYEDNKVERLAQRSVIKWLDKLPAKMPILLLHGTADKRVNVENSIDLAQALKEVGHQHKLVIYDGDDHGLSNNQDNVIDEVDTWLTQYL